MMRSMITFIWMKSIRLVFLLVAISFISFLLVSYSPIDPIQAYVGADMMRVSPEQREQIAQYWGLDKPLLERFFFIGEPPCCRGIWESP